jgi:hypothetical protein
MSANPYEPTPFVKLQHADWSRNATIYQINLRQFTQEGTLGADILWLMPIHPIGLKNRKGSLGSHYAVREIKSI